MYFCLNFRPNSKAAKDAAITEEGLAAAKAAVEEEWKQLGRIRFWEIVCYTFYTILFKRFLARSRSREEKNVCADNRERQVF